MYENFDNLGVLSSLFCIYNFSNRNINLFAHDLVDMFIFIHFIYFCSFVYILYYNFLQTL